MLYIGLSGNRYSGKNRISRLFEQIHIPVFDADLVLKFNMYYNYDSIYELNQKIGNFYFEFGNLNMNRIIKDNKFEIVAKHFEEEIFKAYNRFNLKNSKSIYTIFKSSILFEMDWCKKMDYNISVFAPSNIRSNRCKNDTNLMLSEILNLIKLEMSDLDKNKKADFVIHNYEPTDVLSEVCKLDNELVNKFLYESNTVEEIW